MPTPSTNSNKNNHNCNSQQEQPVLKTPRLSRSTPSHPREKGGRRESGKTPTNNKISTKQFPHHIFKHHKENQTKQSASNIKFKTLKITKLNKQNLANKLAKLSLNLATSNKQRHQAIQDFFITNDSTTIATEIPVYLTKDDIIYFLSKGFEPSLIKKKTPITGHIDILQIRNGLIHILDYKPDAEKENPINQLTLYALALASRTKLDLKSIKCAWFDENNYFEFFPLQVVYKKQK